MTQQIINIGAAPDDKTGDYARVAFNKCNLNFTELYDGLTASLPLGNAIQYQFSNSTSEPPAAEQIRFDNATQAAATKVWASHTTSSGINIKQLLSAATTGATVIIQDKNDNTNYIKFEITAPPIDKTTYWEFPVSVTASGGTLPNAPILASVTPATGGAGGPFQPLDADLSSLASAANTNAIYYRMVADTWVPITIGTYLRFISGDLDVKTGAGGVQLYDGDLAALSALTGVNVIYYRSAADTWSAVTIGTGLTFSGGTLTNTFDTTGLAPLASPTFTGDPQAPTPATADNNTSIATTAFVKAQGYAVGSFLPLSGGTLTGNLTINKSNPLVILDTPTVAARDIQGKTNGSLRWRIVVASGDAESGSNAGSNIYFSRYDDTGTVIDNSVAITRSTGVVAFTASPTAPTPTAGDNSTKLATTAFVAAAGGAGGAMTLLNTLTASNSTQLDDTTSITSAYDLYFLEFENVVPVTNNVAFIVQVALASVFQATGYKNSGAQTDGVYLSTSGIDNTADRGVSGSVHLYGPNGTSNKKWFRGMIAVVSGGTALAVHPLGFFDSNTNAINGLRFKFVSGNISTGKIRIYGVKTS